jgi:hypothetical protein
MKKALFTITVLLTVMSAFCQVKDTAYSAVQIEELLQQSKKKKTSAILMVCAGGALVIGGAVMGASGSNSNDGLVVAGLITSLAGIGVGLASIPMFIKSHKLKEEAKYGSVSLNMQFVPVTAGSGSFARIPQPGLTLIIPLGR